jgi:outer membrane protein W
MRMTAIAAAVLMCAVSASAESTEVSIFTSNLSLSESTNTGSQWSGGAGVALSRVWSAHWASEVAVALQRGHAIYTDFRTQPPGADTQVRAYNVVPIDLTTQYRFTSNSRWTPYVTAGVRYVAAPSHVHPQEIVPVIDGTEIVLRGGFPFDGDRASAEVGAGTGVALTPHVGLRLDVMHLLRSEGVAYDPVTRGSVGVSWKF